MFSLDFDEKYLEEEEELRNYEGFNNAETVLVDPGPPGKMQSLALPALPPPQLPCNAEVTANHSPVTVSGWRGWQRLCEGAGRVNNIQCLPCASVCVTLLA